MQHWPSTFLYKFPAEGYPRYDYFRTNVEDFRKRIGIHYEKFGVEIGNRKCIDQRFKKLKGVVNVLAVERHGVCLHMPRLVQCLDDEDGVQEMLPVDISCSCNDEDMRESPFFVVYPFYDCLDAQDILILKCLTSNCQMDSVDGIIFVDLGRTRVNKQSQRKKKKRGLKKKSFLKKNVEDLDRGDSAKATANEPLSKHKSEIKEIRKVPKEVSQASTVFQDKEVLSKTLTLAKEKFRGEMVYQEKHVSGSIKQKRKRSARSASEDSLPAGKVPRVERIGTSFAAHHTEKQSKGTISSIDDLNGLLENYFGKDIPKKVMLVDEEEIATSICFCLEKEVMAVLALIESSLRNVKSTSYSTSNVENIKQVLGKDLLAVSKLLLSNHTLLEGFGKELSPCQWKNEVELKFAHDAAHSMSFEECVWCGLIFKIYCTLSKTLGNTMQTAAKPRALKCIPLFPAETETSGVIGKLRDKLTRLTVDYIVKQCRRRRITQASIRQEILDTEETNQEGNKVYHPRGSRKRRLSSSSLQVRESKKHKRQGNDDAVTTPTDDGIGSEPGSMQKTASPTGLPVPAVTTAILGQMREIFDANTDEFTSMAVQCALKVFDDLFEEVKTEWTQKINRLHWEVVGLFSLSKIEKPMDIKEPDRHTVDDITAQALLKRVPAVLGCGYSFGRLQIHVEKNIFSAKKNEIQKEIEEILKGKATEAFDIIPVCKRIKRMAHPTGTSGDGEKADDAESRPDMFTVGEEITPKDDEVLAGRKKGRFGTLGGIVRKRALEDSQRSQVTLYGLVSHHVVRSAKYVCLVRDRTKRDFLEIGTCTDAKELDGLYDLSAVEINANLNANFKCMFKNSKGRFKKCRLYKFPESNEVFQEELRGRKVHIWGAKTKPGKGIIADFNYIIRVTEEAMDTNDTALKDCDARGNLEPETSDFARSIRPSTSSGCRDESTEKAREPLQETLPMEATGESSQDQMDIENIETKSKPDILDNPPPDNVPVQRIIIIADEEDKDQSFSTEGDSGAIIVADDPDNKCVIVLSMLVGRQVEGEKKGKYLTFRFEEGLQSLEERTNIQFELVE